MQLPYRVRWQDLKDLFRRAGTVLRADVSLSPDNRSRGYGTVLLASAEDAGRAVDMFNGFSWQGRILEVRLDRLGAVPGVDMDPTMMGGAPAHGLPSVGGLGMVSQMGVNALGGGLQVPSPHPSLPLASHNLNLGGSMSLPVSAGTTGSAILTASAGTSSTTAAVASGLSPSLLSTAAMLNSMPPSSPIHASLLALQQQRQQKEKEREDLFMAQAQAQSRIQSTLKPDLLGGSLGALPGLGAGSTPDSFLSLGALGRGLGSEFPERDSRPASNLGMRSLFVGNVSEEYLFSATCE